MSYTETADAPAHLQRDAEQLHEYLVTECGYSTFDVDVVATSDGIEITVAPGAAAPSDWPAAVMEAYCSRSQRERRRLDERYCRPDRIRDVLKEELGLAE